MDFLVLSRTRSKMVLDSEALDGKNLDKFMWKMIRSHEFLSSWVDYISEWKQWSEKFKSGARSLMEKRNGPCWITAERTFRSSDHIPLSFLLLPFNKLRCWLKGLQLSLCVQRGLGGIIVWAGGLSPLFWRRRCHGVVKTRSTPKVWSFFFFSFAKQRHKRASHGGQSYSCHEVISEANTYEWPLFQFARLISWFVRAARLHVRLRLHVVRIHPVHTHKTTRSNQDQIVNRTVQECEVVLSPCITSQDKAIETIT